MLNLLPQIRVVPYRLWGFQYSRRYHKWGIGTGSSPIGFEGFVQPRKGQGEAKTKLVNGIEMAWLTTINHH